MTACIKSTESLKTIDGPTVNVEHMGGRVYLMAGDGYYYQNTCMEYDATTGSRGTAIYREFLLSDFDILWAKMLSQVFNSLEDHLVSKSYF